MTDLTLFNSTDLIPNPSGNSRQINPARVYIEGLHSERSRITMRRQLNGVVDLMAKVAGVDLPRDDTGKLDDWRCQFYNWAALRRQDLQTLQNRLAEIYSTATVNLMISAVRGVLEVAYDAEQISESEYRQLRKVKNLKGGNSNEAATGRALSQRELNALMAVCAADTSSLGARDAAIIALAYMTGARRAEIATLNLEDISREGDLLKIRICGKGNKIRTGYMRGEPAAALNDWLDVRATTPGPLFIRQMVYGKPGDSAQRLTTQSIYKLMLSRAKQAQIDRFSPHDLRRTCISNHLDAGTDMATVAQIVGHSSVETTAGYDRRGERAKQAAADNLHLAYTPRKKVS